MAAKISGVEWETQALRVSIFLRSPFSTNSVWADITGEEPESDDNRPRQGQRIQQGPFLGGMLEVSNTAPRIDISVTPAPTTEPVYTFGAFEQLSSAFVDRVATWLKATKLDCVRIAYGAVVLAPADDRAAAYDVLSKYVPSVKFDAANSQEAFYRINRPVPCECLKGEVLNRITTWNSIRVRRAFAVGASVEFQEVEHHFARLECDTNTSQDRKEPFAMQDLPRILLELAALAYGNAKNGELG